MNHQDYPEQIAHWPNIISLIMDRISAHHQASRSTITHYEANNDTTYFVHALHNKMFLSLTFHGKVKARDSIVAFVVKMVDVLNDRVIWENLKLSG